MKTKKTITSSMLIGLGLILSIVQILTLPFGGSVTLVSMLPVIMASYLFGLKTGLTAAFAYSLLQMVVGFGTVSAFFLPGDSQMAPFAAISICLVDYVFAYTVLGFGGIFRGKLGNETKELCLGVTVAVMLRFIMHIISGYIFFGAWAEWFFADSTGLSQIGFMKGFCSWVMNSFEGPGLSLFYSVVYNGAYMIPELIFTLIAAPLVFKILKKSNNAKI